ncbi:MAG: MarR family transcriptional regulator [Anaerolineaceae bacterium]|jgi:DNA-binding MarR family transcriptional regulator|nr:MAG: MarR family transcriptional regulator [Anaerolineaceae bacterium]
MNDPSGIESLGRMFPCICRAHKKNADVMLERSGLHHGQAKLLMILAHENGISHSEIAAKLRISPAATTKVIKRMEQNGYVLREPDEADERISRVFLQPKGMTLVNKIHSTFQQLDLVMFDGFTDEDIQTLQSLLMRIQNNLQKNVSDAD